MKYILNCLFLLLLSTTSGESPPLNVPRELIIYMPPPEPVIVDVHERVNDLAILHPVFRNKVVKLLHEAAKQGIKLEVVETYRTPERQNHLRRQGFSMLHGGKSKHQHRIAVDVVPVKFGWYMWHDKELWTKIGKLGKEQGLIWGGDWKRFRDYPHFEYPISIDSLHLLSIPDTVIVPLNY